MILVGLCISQSSTKSGSFFGYPLTSKVISQNTKNHFFSNFKALFYPFFEVGSQKFQRHSEERVNFNQGRYLWKFFSTFLLWKWWPSCLNFFHAIEPCVTSKYIQKSRKKSWESTFLIKLFLRRKVGQPPRRGKSEPGWPRVGVEAGAAPVLRGVNMINGWTVAPSFWS